MKFVVLSLLLTTATIAAPKATQRILPVTKEDEVVKNEKATQAKLKALEKKEEDCDEKAKKPIQITPQSISLSGQAGCSLDEAH
jgi:cell envelope opacity-associated protein A